MKSDEAMDFLTRIRKTLPGIENFLQATLVKEHLSKQARDELHSLLHLLSHVQLAALPSQGKKQTHRPQSRHPPPSFSSSNLESERNASTSLGSSGAHTETDTEQSPISFDSSPFSSPTRTVGFVTGSCNTIEVKSSETECASSSGVVERKKSVENPPIAVSRSGRPIKVAPGRINSDYVTGTITREKRRKRESSDSSNLSLSPTKKHKSNPTTSHTHNLSQQFPNCKHISAKSSITNWTKTTKRKPPVVKSLPPESPTNRSNSPLSTN